MEWTIVTHIYYYYFDAVSFAICKSFLFFISIFQVYQHWIQQYHKFIVNNKCICFETNWMLEKTHHNQLDREVLSESEHCEQTVRWTF